MTKQLFWTIAPTAALMFTVGFQDILSAQKVATWKGGTPGRNTDWYCATNWIEGRVPNEFSQVIIPDVSTTTSSAPVLGSGEVEVFSLLIHSGASLRIAKNARLIARDQEEDVAWGEGLLLEGMMPNRVIYASR